MENKTKTIENQGEKQFEALKYLKPKQKAKETEDKFDDDLLMQKETFNRLLDERMDDIQKIGKKVNYNNLTYNYIFTGIRPTNFIESRGLLHIFIENSRKRTNKTQIKMR